MKIISEDEVIEKIVPGRFLRWIVGSDDSIHSKFCSCCVMRVLQGETVQPAHCHPTGEELIYIIKGKGKVYVDGLIKPVREGSAVLFEQGKIHMVRNTGSEEMKVICFFAPATNLDKYEYHPEVNFDSGIES